MTTFPRVALVALNAHFAHTSLAIRLLREAACAAGFPRDNLILCEWTINDLPPQLLQRLFAVEADLYAFSCYIWNRRLCERLSDELKKVRPDAVIIWGGPEATQDAVQILQVNPAVDAILAGEGEKAFADLLLASQNLQNASTWIRDPAALSQLPNLVYRGTGQEIRRNSHAPLLLAESWSFPYTDDELLTLKDRLLYFETSRGCPYGCTYCLSALDRTVRLLDVPRVVTAFERLITAGLRQVKLVDRTFNIQPARAFAIWHWLIARQAQATADGQPFRTNFHFEIMADRLSLDGLELLKTAPAGLIQFEIGVQTTTPEVLRTIHRPCDWQRLAENVRFLRAQSAIHLHLDLIAGLPGETPSQFARSFDEVFALKPHQLQLGFLKVLPGSPMADQARERQFSWSNEPPYEILSSDEMTYADLAGLKDLEAVLELYYNSGRFPLSLQALLDQSESAFAVFDALAQANRIAGWFDLKASPAARAAFLADFARQRLPADAYPDFMSRLKLDYLLQGAKDQPTFLDLLETSLDPRRQAIKQLGRSLIHDRYPRQSRFRLEDFHFSQPVRLQELPLSRHELLIPPDLAELPSGPLLCGWDISAAPLTLLFAESLDKS